MNTTNNAASVLVAARTVKVGDRLEHFGTFFLVTEATVVTAAITFSKSLEAELDGYGLVSIPAGNSVNVVRA